MHGSHWRLANAAAVRAGVVLRALDSLDDASSVVRVMAATWGEEIPRETVRALAGSGNVPWGAVEDGEVVGFVLGWLGVSPVDGLHEHSHMLATLPHRRHGGVGYALKLAQRASCLDRGVHLVRWTFDPLVARNAHLNLNKLGAVCDRFHRDYYGQMPDAINAGDRSDRLVVRWAIDDEPRSSTVPSGASFLVRSDGTPEAPVPVSDAAAAGGEVLAIQIPPDHAALRAADPALGAAWREAVGAALRSTFDAGRIVTAFDPDRRGGRPTYFLTRADDS